MILEWILITGCAGQPEYREACKRSTEAGLNQSGVYSFMEKVEYSASKRARIQLEQLDLIEVAGASAFVYKTVKDKNIGYTLKKPGVLATDTIGGAVGLKGANINLGWSID